MQKNMWKVTFKKFKKLQTLTMWKGWDFMGTYCDTYYVLYKELHMVNLKKKNEDVEKFL